MQHALLPRVLPSTSSHATFRPRAGVTTSSFAGSGPAADQDDRTIAGLHIPGSSTLYTLLSLLQLVAGIAALIAPYRVRTHVHGFCGLQCPRHAMYAPSQFPTPEPVSNPLPSLCVQLTDIFFKHHIIAPDLLYEELWRLLAGVLFAGAATAYALKVSTGIPTSPLTLCMHGMMLVAVGLEAPWVWHDWLREASVFAPRNLAGGSPQK